MINIIKYSVDKGVHETPVDKLVKWDFECKENLWIDIYNSTEAESQRLLNDVFGFHALAIEDSFKFLKDSAIHHPKIDDFQSYLFIVFNGLKDVTNSFKYQMFPLSCFLGYNFLVTIHNEGDENTITKNFNSILNERTFRKGPDFILNIILDNIVDRYYPILDNIENEIDDVEEELFEGTPGNATLQKILNLKKELIRLRRISSYQKEVLFKLTRGDSDLISNEESIYYRNVYDHLVRVADTTESYRDYVTGMLDSYLSIVNNKMNEVMKFLTIIATIILPLSFVTGIFGMNFDFIPFLHDIAGFWFSMIAMAAIAIGMLLWFRQKKWI